MASEVRSGSTFFAELISYSFHKSYGEEFWDLSRELLSTLKDSSTRDEMLSITRNLYLNKSGYRSCKIMCAQLSIISREARKDQEIKDIFFGDNTYWIVFRRKNKIKQAISLAMARKSNIYHSYDADMKVSKADTVSMEDIDRALKAIAISDEYLKCFSKNFKNYIEIFYEDALEAQKQSVTDVITKLDMPFDISRLQIEEPKLKPYESLKKTELENRFIEWFSINYHSTQ
ncbi:hypothetical protein AA0243_0847 [Novacetimonas hansenii NRIC 0243]|nr:hypothetical protein AA0243_0847 [Novacetimonas hansenii NRIC 0243]